MPRLAIVILNYLRVSKGTHVTFLFLRHKNIFGFYLVCVLFTSTRDKHQFTENCKIDVHWLCARRCSPFITDLYIQVNC